MHPALTQALDALDHSRDEVRHAVDTVPAPLRDQPPAPNRWSVASVIEHLAIVAERSVLVVERKIDEARAANAGAEESSPALLSSHHHAALVDRSAKREAPEIARPAGIAFTEAVARFDAAHAQLHTLLTGADGLALGRRLQEHPRFGALNPYQWVGFVAAHESRHAQQIVEIAAELDAKGINLRARGGV